MLPDNGKANYKVKERQPKQVFCVVYATGRTLNDNNQ